MRTTHTPRRATAVLAATTIAMLAAAMPASAHATCSDFEGLDIEVHGHHVVRDYVAGDLESWPPSGGQVGSTVAADGVALAGGPGAHGHLSAGIAPGASFCNPQANSPGWRVGP